MIVTVIETGIENGTETEIVKGTVTKSPKTKAIETNHIAPTVGTNLRKALQNEAAHQSRNLILQVTITGMYIIIVINQGLKMVRAEVHQHQLRIRRWTRIK